MTITVPPPREAAQETRTAPGVPTGPAVAADPSPPLLGTYYEISGRLSWDEARGRRYELQSRARAWLIGDRNPAGRSWRVCRCLRQTTQPREGPAVVRSIAHKGTRFSGLVVCGSVWTCPVCAVKITERRRAEVAGAMDLHAGAGGGALMITLTHAHRRADDLAQLVYAFRRAHHGMVASRQHKALLAELGQVGRIRALETTWGKTNGWHPHSHEILLIAKPFDLAELERVRKALSGQWIAACDRAGLPLPDVQHGVSVEIAWSPAQYLAKFGHDTKWGSARELTKAHVKQAGHGARFTPFDLLRAAADALPDAPGLWRTYAAAYHGSRQLMWSRGLRAAMGIEELSDEAIAASRDDEHQLVCRISRGDWRRVLHQPRDVRARILEMADREGARGVEMVLSGLAQLPVAQ